MSNFSKCVVTGDAYQHAKIGFTAVYAIFSSFDSRPIFVSNSIFKECGDNTYGAECKQPCGNCSNGKPCHHLDGSCPSGCDGGVYGDKCDIGNIFHLHYIIYLFNNLTIFRFCELF